MSSSPSGGGASTISGSSAAGRGAAGGRAGGGAVGTSNPVSRKTRSPRPGGRGRGAVPGAAGALAPLAGRRRGVRRAAARLEVAGDLGELLERLLLPRRGPQQLDQHHPDLLAAGELVGELLHRLKRLVELPERVHPLEELDQVPLGLDDHVLAGVELGQLEVGLGPARD